MTTTRGGGATGARGCLVLGAMVAGMGCSKAAGSSDGSGQAALTDAWHRLDHCLVGTNERPHTPPHTIAAMLWVQTRASTDASDWPSRCAPYVKALREQLELTPLEDAGFFDPSDVAVEQPLHDGEVPGGVFLDSLFREGRRRFGRPSATPAGVAAAPELAVSFPPGALVPLLPISTMIDAAQWSDGQLVLAFDDYHGLCRLDAAADPPRARCQYLPDAGPPRGSDDLPWLADGAPTVYQARSGSWHRLEDGVELLPCASPGACVGFVDDADNAVARALRDDGGYELVTVRGGEASTTRLDRPGATAAKVELIGEHLIWTETEGDGRRVLARAVKQDGLGEVEAIAVIPDRPWRASCRYGDDLHLYFHDRTYGNGEVGPGRILSRMSGRWLEPQVVDMPSGELSCGPGGAAIHGHDTEGASLRVWLLRCGADGCREEEGSVARRESSNVVIVPVGDRVAMLETTTVVTLRVGPLAELDGVAPTMLMLAEGQVGDLVHAVHAMARGNHVVAVVRGGEALYALRVDADGRVQPFVAGAASD